MDSYCSGYQDVWHTFTPTNTGDYRIHASGSDMSWIVTVFDACDGNHVGCSYSGGSDLTLTQGTAYKIAVACDSPGETGTYTLTVTESIQ